MGKNKIINLVFFLIIFLFVILYNFINLNSKNYPLTEGLQYNFINLNSYYPNGKSLDFPLDINSLEDNNINKNIFINGGFMLNNENKLYPFSLAGSSYIFSTIIKIVNVKNYSIFMGLFGLISLIFFYLSLKLLLCSKRLAIIGTLFFSFSYGFFQYYSFLSDSIIALSIFIISYFYFLKYYDNSKYIYLFIASFLFTTALIIRIDYLLIAPILLFLIFPNIIKNINIKLLGIIISILLIFSTLLISNFFRHGSPISFGYEKEKSNIEYVGNIKEKNKITVLFKRFFSNFNNINAAKKRFLANQKFLGYIISMSFIFIFFFIINKKKNLLLSNKQLYFQLIYLLLIYLYISSMYFTDVGTSWIMSVHTRYLLPFYYIILLYSFSFGLKFFYKRVNYSILIILIILILSILIFFESFNKPMGINDLINRKNKTNIFYNNIGSLGKKDFLFSFFDRSGSINLKKNGPYIIHLPYIKGQNINNEDLINSIDYLLGIDKDVYIYSINKINNKELIELYNTIKSKYILLNKGNNIYKITIK